MWFATKYGLFSVVRAQAPDDGEPAIYYLQSNTRKNFEMLLGAAGMHREILESADAASRYRIAVNQQEVFEVMSHLVESVDYESVEGMQALRDPIF